MNYYIHGNSYLAVYVGGLVVGNSKLVHRRSIFSFFDGLSWLCQLLMFLTLGLLVNPSELWPVLIPGLVISFLMIFITRPLSVFLSLIPFHRVKFRDKAFLSWVGLRGAVPIVFAIMCRAADVPHSHEIFNIVFICTLVSLVIQGTTITAMAKWLGLDDKTDEKQTADSFDMVMPDGFQSQTIEADITAATLQNHGNRLMDFRMPDSIAVLMVKRNDSFFIPNGKTTLQVADRLMIVGDDLEKIRQVINHLQLDECVQKETKMITEVLSEQFEKRRVKKKQYSQTS